MSMSSPYRGPVEVSYLFIDGAYLRGVLESIGEECYGNPLLPIDFAALAQGFTKVFYYDCLAGQKAQESDADYAVRVSAQEAHFRKLRSLRGWHVIEGVVKRTGKRARQKEVDILIAVDMLTHTHRRNMHRVAFIAGDQDFRPLVEAVVREGMFIELWFEQSSASSELVYTADAHRQLDPYVIQSWLPRKYQTENPLPTRSGQPECVIEAPVIAEATTSNSRLELYQARDGFIIKRPEGLNEGYCLLMSHPNVDFLKKVHALTYGSTEWVNLA